MENKRMEMKKNGNGLCVMGVSLLLLVFGLSGCANPEEEDLKILRSALEKNQELSLKLVSYNRSISDEKTALFMRDNFENRNDIIGSLKGSSKSEKGALGTLAVEEFLKMENAYCESMALASLAKQRAYAIGGTGYRSENSADRTAEKHIMQARAYRVNLKALEANLEQYGWKKTWGREVGATSANSATNQGKPDYVDSTQWQYIQKFELKTLINTDSYYSWIAVEKTEGPTPRALVAVKSTNSVVMPVFTERFFCEEKRVMIESAVHVAQGYAIPKDGYITSSPIKIIPNTAEDAAHKFLCEKKSWWQRLFAVGGDRDLPPAPVPVIPKPAVATNSTPSSVTPLPNVPIANNKSISPTTDPSQSMSPMQSRYVDAMSAGLEVTRSTDIPWSVRREKIIAILSTPVTLGDWKYIDVRESKLGTCNLKDQCDEEEAVRAARVVREGKGLKRPSFSQ